MRTAKPGPDSTVRSTTPDLARNQFIFINRNYFNDDTHTFFPHRMLQTLQKLFQDFFLSVAWGIQAIRVPEMVGAKAVGDVGDGRGEGTGRGREVDPDHR